jgi:hypothetical protein
MLTVHGASQQIRMAAESRHSSAQRFDEAPKFDGRLGSGTVPVIPIPLALGRTSASTLHAADLAHGPAKLFH